MNMTYKRPVLRRVLSVLLSCAMMLGSMVSTNLQFTVSAAEGHQHSYDEKGFCTVKDCTQPYEKPDGDGSVGNPYRINNAGKLYYFAGVVNGDNSICVDGVNKNVSANAKLTADIIINDGKVDASASGLRQWTPIANTLDGNYLGTFDGCNHVIRGLYINDDESAMGGGLFSYVGTNGLIKNVGIENSYINVVNYVGSIVYYHKGSIENCYSTASLQTKGANDNGGLVGSLCDGASINNCYFAGTYTGKTSDTYMGGIVGNKNGASSIETTSGNCYFLPGNGIKAYHNIGEERTKEQFASGQVAYELNSNQTETVFGQILSGEGVSADDVQSFPVLGGKRVGIQGSAVCPGDRNIHQTGYVNAATDAITYQYSKCEYENGFCKYSGECEVPKGDGTANNPYQIRNAGQLYYFAGIVNGDKSICVQGVKQNKEACAKLMADIVLNDGEVNAVNDRFSQWIPIGAEEFYKGIFDGCNYVIRGLYINSANDYQGLFGYMQGTVKNLGIENSYISGKKCLGSIAGKNIGIIENCYSTAILKAAVNDDTIGGLSGYMEGKTSVIKNSYFAGKSISATKENQMSAIVGIKNLSGTCENCYFLSADAVYAATNGVKARTKEQFASGQVAYELNKGRTETVFGQILSGEGVSADAVQALPVLGGLPVFEKLTKPCPGVADEEEAVVHSGIYTNHASEQYSYLYPQHNYVSYVCQYCGRVAEHQCEYVDGFCKYCNSYDPSKGDGTQENPYQIATAEQLIWVAARFNEAWERDEFYAANIKLMNDIYLNPEGVTAASAEVQYWNMIQEYPENAVFDGQGYTIYGLCYQGREKFGFINENNGTICNVTFAGVSVILTDNYSEYGTVCIVNDNIISDVKVLGTAKVLYTEEAGGICAEGLGLIRNCVSYMDIAAGQCAGGICGIFSGRIENCKNYGSVSGVGMLGGIAGGITSRGEIRHCGNYGNIQGSKTEVGGICGVMSNSVIQQCYNMADITAMEREAGGIVGSVYFDSSIKYCFSFGKIQIIEYPYYYAGGIAGVVDDYYTMEECYYSGSGIGTGIGFSIAEEDVDNYDMIAASYRKNEIPQAKEDEAFRSGEIVWLLNRAYTEDWLYQTDDGDIVFASSGEGSPVARKAIFGCSGSKEPLSVEYFYGKEDITTYKYKLHNFEAETLTCTECGEVLAHLCIYGEDGYCVICHACHVPKGKGTQESPYELSNVAELYWYAGLINGDEDICKNGIEKNVEACAVLTENIVLNEEPLSEDSSGAAVWTPIGLPENSLDYSQTSKNFYQGSFDGQGYTITGIYIPSDNILGGFFGYAGRGADIKNLNLENVYIEGSEYSGGICSILEGTLEGCCVSGNITAKLMGGGIAGMIHETARISGCHNIAQIQAGAAGGIVGFLMDGSIVGCYNTGKLTGTMSGNTITEANGIAGFAYSYEGVLGCYYLSETETAGAAGVCEPANAETLASGQVAWKMNAALKKAGLDAEYGQILTGEEAQSYPVWKEETTVYSIGVASCPGVEVTDSQGYSNDSSVTQYQYENHQYEDGSYFCTFCGAVKKHECEYEYGYCKHCSGMSVPEGKGTAESPYQISNAGELFWFRDKVSGDLKDVAANSAACAVLTDNIDIQEVAEATGQEKVYWTPFGVSKNTGKINEYQGQFDGQGYTISGVAIQAYEPDGQYIGVFGQIGKEGVVTDLHIANAEQKFDYRECYDMLSDDERYLGAFCNVNKGVVSGCSIDVQFSATNGETWYYMTGFVGRNTGSIINSSTTGEVFDISENMQSGTDNYISGFCGVNEGLLTGCCNDASIYAFYVSAGICIENQGRIEKCYNTNDSRILSLGNTTSGISTLNEGSITNCWNEADLMSGVNFASGLCSYNAGELAYCYHIGSAVYGIAGNSETSIQYCYAQSDSYTSSLIGRNNNTFMNVEELMNVEEKSQEAFASGEVTYELNQAQGKKVFGQTLYSEDESGVPTVSIEAVQAYPQLDGKTVYPVGMLACPGCGLEDEFYVQIQGYSNIPGQMTYAYSEHCYDYNGDGVEDSNYCCFCKHVKEDTHTCTYENGICKQCGWFEVPEGDGTKEHPYEISNAGQLRYFAHVVEGISVDGKAVSGNAVACARLVQDIDLANVPETAEEVVTVVSGGVLEWKAIGVDMGTVYEGTFDGQGHSIHGMTVRGEAFAALFAKTGKNAVVKNLTLSDCSVMAVESAAISVINEGTIENCMVEGWVAYAENQMDYPETYEEYVAYQKFMRMLVKLYSGGMDFMAANSSSVQCMSGGISVINRGKIQSCWMNGMAAGIDKAGFICAENQNGTVSNCYYYSNADGQQKEYIDELELVTGKGIGNKNIVGESESVLKKDIQSGRLAWMLDTDNKLEGNNGIWKQNMVNSVPTLATRDAVTLYYLSAAYLDGVTEEYYVPAGADISEYLQNTEGAKWVIDGGTPDFDNGTLFTETRMNSQVLVIREEIVPSGVITVGQKKWYEYTRVDGYTTWQAEGAVIDIETDSKDTRIAYYIHEADTVTEAALSMEELVKKPFTEYKEASKPVLSENGYVAVYARLTSKNGVTSYISTEGLDVRNARLLSITTLKDITGVVSGTKKDAVALGLPKNVAIKTEGATVTGAAVIWDLDNLVEGSYDSSLTTKQVFTVSGSVVLPEEIDANGIELIVQISVTVEAAKEEPSSRPSEAPSTKPSETPSTKPSVNPSEKPSTKPSAKPSVKPSVKPSEAPSAKPSVKPSETPSAKPSETPSAKPSETPSTKPSVKPSVKPSETPSAKPSVKPSETPSAKPSETPSTKPSVKPSEKPSTKPSAKPSVKPSVKPSEAPSAKPSVKPSETPSAKPSETPSAKPSETPSTKPSVKPSVKPSETPSAKPSVKPSETPSAKPSTKPGASENPTPSEKIVQGDVDGNGTVELLDAQLALKAALKIITLNEDALKAADVDQESGVGLGDAQMILKYALKIISRFE